MFNFTEGNGYYDILKRMLDRIPDTLDKRQGSIIYDALAPAASELAQNYISLDVYANQTYLLEAVGENLDNKAADYGMERSTATKSKRVCMFVDSNNQPMTISVGVRLSVPNDYGGYNFVVTDITDSSLSEGEYVLECETPGSVGDRYFGELLPLSVINNLGTATLGRIYEGGVDTETDDNFRDRILLKLREIPFGGNIAQYKTYVQNSGDGSIKTCIVIPVWDGGGTVKIVPITRNNDIPTTAQINELQELIDPSQDGSGIGLAPIGHIVTVSPPDEYTINVKVYVDLEQDYDVNTVKPYIEEAISEYIKEVQNLWDTQDTLHIYISRVSAASYVQGVVNVASVLLNNASSDIVIHPKQGDNEFPKLGTVDVYEN